MYVLLALFSQVLDRLLSLSAGKDILFSSEFDQDRDASDSSIDALQVNMMSILWYFIWHRFPLEYIKYRFKKLA